MKKHLTILIFALFPQIFCAGALLASPLNGLTEAEQAYHDKIFDYVMDTVNPDQKYDWSSYSGKGSIEVGKPFVSKSRSNCREFTENYTVQGSAGKSKGYGCRRSNGGGWCRLKADEVLTCALERRFFQEIMDAERYLLMRYFMYGVPEEAIRELKRYILDHYLFPKTKGRKSAKKKPK